MKELSDTVTADLAKIAYASGEWSFPKHHKGKSVLEVAIIGAGQGGLASAFALRRLGVTNTQIFERASAGQEGPWTTFARMITLRTPKHVTGPDLGIPSLTPQSWFEARYGVDAWQELGKISRQDWQSYLDWLRQTLAIPVVYDTTLAHIGWEDGLIRLTLVGPEGQQEVFARKLVLATGIDGGGEWFIPSFIKDNVTKTHYAHTHEAIDFEFLRGKRVGVLGAGASAFDNAATALEAGAEQVELAFRRKELPKVNPYRWMENAGFLAHFAKLPDITRWRFMNHIYGLNQPPPQDTFWRCRKHDNFALLSGTPWLSARQSVDGKTVEVQTADGVRVYDFLIVGTGFTVDLALRPEMCDVASSIACWRDRFIPPKGEESVLLSSHPYLGERFQFLPKNPHDEKADMLAAIHNFTFAATPSMGLGGSSISGMRFGVDRLARGIAEDLFVQDGDLHLESLLSYQTAELISLDPPPEGWNN
ncbi:NAD(P)/FAD-dependent oxidoreductase [Neokomagataea sp. TBRC 2177]|uniref:NAD(P)/FAD-dependent oxidoreductase n=1 Tax=Neokomagataea anthophila TaxID=2826925 RepID=A0ABS5E977_9PROT|nr:NAD(P)/FAD-dependent oxidoreductase [Neokomagataea anthophila]MBR0560436.1 NAD(P)/FAD-dependent oxidoreductase [Neokomagataea anthophila]